VKITSDCREVKQLGEPFRLRVSNSKPIRLEFGVCYYACSGFSRANQFIDKNAYNFSLT